MPLAMAVASPELASGKVFIRYPITPVSDAPFIENNDENNNDVSVGNHIITHKDPQMVAIAPAVSEAIVADIAQTETTESTYSVTVSTESTTEAVAEIVAVEPQTVPVEADVISDVINEVNTEEHVTRKENISAVLNTTEAYMHETSQQTETNIAPEEVAQDTVVAVESETSTLEPQPVEAVVATEETVEQHKEVVVETVAAPVVEADVEAIVENQPAESAAPVVEVEAVTESKPTEVVIRQEPVVVARQLHASSPMTKAPAANEAPVAIEIKAWEARPAFDKKGRSGAGGHCSTNHASSEMTKAESQN